MRSIGVALATVMVRNPERARTHTYTERERGRERERERERNQRKEKDFTFEGRAPLALEASEEQGCRNLPSWK